MISKSKFIPWYKSTKFFPFYIHSHKKMTFAEFAKNNNFCTFFYLTTLLTFRSTKNKFNIESINQWTAKYVSILEIKVSDHSENIFSTITATCTKVNFSQLWLLEECCARYRLVVFKFTKSKEPNSWYFRHTLYWNNSSNKIYGYIFCTFVLINLKTTKWEHAQHFPIVKLKWTLL